VAEAARARSCYVRAVRFASLLALSTTFFLTAALSAALTACTETPGYFPPCVDPYTPCTDAGASEGGPGDATMADAPTEGAVTDATAEANVTDATPEAAMADGPGEATTPDAP
jgi:hypothetical protein